MLVFHQYYTSLGLIFPASKVCVPLGSGTGKVPKASGKVDVCGFILFSSIDFILTLELL